MWFPRLLKDRNNTIAIGESILQGRKASTEIKTGQKAYENIISFRQNDHRTQ